MSHAGDFSHTEVTEEQRIFLTQKVLFSRSYFCSHAEARRTFETKRTLDTSTNVQFGEGGAGTFSDGKLTTRINDSRCNWVLDQLVAHGAPEEITRKAKPHIGTDLLGDVVKSIREDIISMGGQVLFNTRMTDIITKNGSVCAVRTDKGEFPAGA